MITPSLIYIAVTVLLAFVDAIRIKKAKGIVENIDHKISVSLALYGGVFTLMIWSVINFKPGEWHWNYIPKALIIALSFAPIRLAVFDLCLNIMRRMKIDYVSAKTNAYEDQHTNKLSFWEKRAIGIAGWVICIIVYHVIFKK